MRADTTELVEVGRFSGQAAAEQHALVLTAVGIACRLVPEAGGAVGLFVEAIDAERARRQLAQYAAENAPSRRPRQPPRALLRGFDAALVYCAVLLFCFGAQNRGAWSIDWTAAGAAQAGLILDGAWWRTLTALTLHADLGHLMSNLAFGVAFGLLAAQVLGSGVGWLAILLSGALGNALVAFVHSAGHTAIGASTALFGALGMLAGYERRTRVVPWRGGLRRWAPLAAGVMLLVFLGVGGERTDVAAHAAGFVIGVATGFALAHVPPQLLQERRLQWICGALACGLLALAWLLALTSRPV